MMVACKLGVPNRTYFEIFTSTHPSEKVYSVQVKEWVEENSYEVRDKNQSMYENKAQRVYEDTPAVVDLHPEKVLKSKADHVQVEPTQELVKFLAKRGVEIPNGIWVQPMAFEWEDGECEAPEVEIETPVQEEKKINSKTWLAIALAALSFLK